MKDYKSVLSKCKKGDKVRYQMTDYFTKEDARKHAEKLLKQYSKPIVPEGEEEWLKKTQDTIDHDDRTYIILTCIALAILILGLIGVGLLLAGAVSGDAPQPRVTNIYPQETIKEITQVVEGKIVHETVQSDKFADCIKIQGVGNRGYVLECEEQ